MYRITLPGYNIFNDFLQIFETFEEPLTMTSKEMSEKIFMRNKELEQQCLVLEQRLSAERKERECLEERHEVLKGNLLVFSKTALREIQKREDQIEALKTQ